MSNKIIIKNIPRDNFIASLLTEQEAEMIIKMLDSEMEDDNVLAKVLFKEKLIVGIRKYLALLPPIFTENFIKDINDKSVFSTIKDLDSAFNYVGVFTLGSKLKRLKEDYDRIKSTGYNRLQETVQSKRTPKVPGKEN